MGGLLPQLWAYPIYFSTSEIINKKDYCTDYLRMWSKAVLSDVSEDIEKDIRQYQPLESFPLQLSDRNTILEAFPAISKLEKRLISVIREYYPLLEGEQILKDYIEITREKYENILPGTVVYVRQTESALIYFVLMHLLLDLETGVPQIIGLNGTTDIKREFKSNNIVLVKDAAAVDFIFTIASNLVWALPFPWGPVAGAGVSVLELLFQSSPENPVGALLDRAVEQIKNFIKQEQISKDVTILNGFSEWLLFEITVMEKTKVTNNEYIRELIDTLRSNTRPGGANIYQAIYDLQHYVDMDGVMDLLTTGITLYLLGLKMIVQLEAQLANNFKDKNDGEFAKQTSKWLLAYAEFETAISGGKHQGNNLLGWSEKIQNKIQEFYNTRMGKISGTYRYNNRRLVHEIKGITHWVNHWGWAYKDAEFSEDDLRHFKEDTIEGGSCCHAGHNVEHRDSVEQERTRHIAEVMAVLDSKYAKSKKVATKWTDMIKEWNQNLPPQPPQSAPEIDPNGWNGLPPNIPLWKEGNEVAYAVAFVNARGPSEVGPYCEAVKIKPESGASLISLPADPLKMTNNVWIYRKIIDATGVETVRIIGGVAESAKAFHDIGK